MPGSNPPRISTDLRLLQTGGAHGAPYARKPENNLHKNDEGH
jgi:hypothetical protein